MSRHSHTIDSSCQTGESEIRRRSTPLAVMTSNHINSAPPVPGFFSPPPTPRSRTPRSDRLSLRLRSNSGMNLHVNETALSQYIDYDSSGKPMSPYGKRNGSLTESLASRIGESLSPGLSPTQSKSWTATDLAECLPFLNFLEKDAFQMALESPSVVRHLTEYAVKNGCEEIVEFLMKIREYDQITQHMAAVLSSVAAGFTGIGAISPINLPPSVSRPLNSDMKKIANSILPHLEHVFFDAKSYVENRLARDIFPSFVKSQLVYCTAMELASGNARGPSQLQYPGLGGSFCLIGSSVNGHSLIGVTDDFVSLTGHSYNDAVGKIFSFLQGPFTDMDAIRRINVAVIERREVAELILNHRADGEPFWNLSFLFPLKDSEENLHYWLGAQINVSECMNNQKDLLRVLNGGVGPDVDSADDTSHSDQSIGRESARDDRSQKPSSIHNRYKSLSSSRNRLFQPFRRPSLSGGSVKEGIQRHKTAPPYQSEYVRSSQSSARFQPRAAEQAQLTAYSHYLVLRCVRGDRRPILSDARKKSSMKLIVAFCAEAAMDLLSISANVSETDVFHVLAEKAGSPSVTKSFKSLVRENFEGGKAVKLDLLLDKSRKRGASTANSTSRPARSDLESFRQDERADKKLSKTSKHEKILSHWIPLKDAQGNTDWAVLILAPAT